MPIVTISNDDHAASLVNVKDEEAAYKDVKASDALQAPQQEAALALRSQTRNPKKNPRSRKTRIPAKGTPPGASLPGADAPPGVHECRAGAWI